MIMLTLDVSVISGQIFKTHAHDGACWINAYASSYTCFIPLCMSISINGCVSLSN